jgi:undecaprenyl-diphosphatase
MDKSSPGSRLFEKIDALDIKISRRVRMDHGSARGWRWVVFFAHSGDSWFWLAGLFLVALFSKPYRHLSDFLIAAILGLAALVMLIKFTVRRRRPPGEWGAVYRNTDPHSFPSGHAARATMLAVIAIVSGPIWSAVALGIWAVLVSLSRVLSGMHYFSDMVAGILIGIAAGQAAVLSRPLLSALLPALF